MSAFERSYRGIWLYSIFTLYPLIAISLRCDSQTSPCLFPWVREEKTEQQWDSNDERLGMGDEEVRSEKINRDSCCRKKA